VGAVIAVPEIWAAVAGDAGSWPTISGTTGHLEDLWKLTAVIVVALIVIAAAWAVGYGKPAPLAPRLRAGRPQVPQASAQLAGEWWPYVYFGIAVVCTAVASLATAGLAGDGGEARFVVGYVMYGLIGFFFLFLPATFGWALAFFFARDVPFPPILRTIHDLEKRVPLVALVVLAGLVILLIHLALYPWPDISHHQPKPGSP
jgi:hypothetical protein